MNCFSWNPKNIHFCKCISKAQAEYIRRIEGHNIASFIYDDILEHHSHFASITFYPKHKYLMAYKQILSLARREKNIENICVFVVEGCVS